MSKRGQITIFIILGVVLLLMFIFLSKVKQDIASSSLASEKEKVISNTFKKESLRIYVDGCLEIEMENALRLIGRQGRIWDDQGGTLAFVEGETGVLVNEERIFLAIRDEGKDYYPCRGKEKCYYEYPSNDVSLGRNYLRWSAIEDDLKSFLENKVKACVQEYVESEISRGAKPEPTDIEIRIYSQNDAVRVLVDYPLSLKIAGEEIFQRTNFDFVYQTRLKPFIQTVALRPLLLDSKYIDFDYGEDIVKDVFEYKNPTDFGSCMFIRESFYDCSLGLFKQTYDSFEMITPEITKQDNGDTLFKFTSGVEYSILNSPGKFTYTFARQNRPPALSYIHRKECIILKDDGSESDQSYDYLVIPNHEKFGDIEFELIAKDPDEDENIEFSHDNTPPLVPTDVDDSEKNPKYVPPQSTPISSLSGKYNVKITAKDEHEDNSKEDSQTVRVLVDSGVNPNLGVQFPEGYNGADGFEIPSKAGPENEEYYIMSKEDPIFIKLDSPGESEVELKESFLTFFYGRGVETPIPISDNTPNCLAFPSESEISCDLINYPDIKNIKTPFLTLIKDGKLAREISINSIATYCPDGEQVQPTDDVDSQEEQKQINFDETKRIEFVDCVPVQNKDGFEFAYPYNMYKKDGDKVTKETSNIPNPFLATHSCCLASESNPDNWYLAGSSTECFNGYLHCDGTVTGSSFPSEEGFLLLEDYDVCSGERGNICGDFDDKPETRILIKEKTDSGEKEALKCAKRDTYSDSNGNKECKANSQCEKPFDWVDGGWCQGSFGCGEELCDKPMVYTGTDFLKANFDLYDLAVKNVEKKEYYDEGSFEVQCGECSKINQPCKNGPDSEGSCQGPEEGPWECK